MAKAKQTHRSKATIRRDIRDIDKEIIAAVCKRIELAKELQADGEAKENALDWIPKVVGSSNGLKKEDGARLLLEIQSLCQKQLPTKKISYLGPKFSYSYLAATSEFGSFKTLEPLRSITAVFESVMSGQSTCGVVPLENSTDGRIADTLTMFSTNAVRIVQEIHLPVGHCLVGLGKLSEIREIRSKAQAISQCRGWLAENLSSDVVTVAVNSSAEAAADAKKRGTSVAAIASQEAAVGYGLRVIRQGIEDQSGNLTRFAVIADPAKDFIKVPKKTSCDKTSIMFEVPHQAGALADVMNVFKRAKLNLTWIESFPKPEVFSEYTFFAEFQGHRDEVRVRNALRMLERKTEQLTFLGSYPAVGKLNDSRSGTSGSSSKQDT